MDKSFIQIAYLILKKLSTGKRAEYMASLIGPEVLKCDNDLWLEVLRALSEDEYIKGIRITTDILGNKYVDIEKARITMKGAEYLANNSAFKDIANIATNVIAITKDFV